MCKVRRIGVCVCAALLVGSVISNGELLNLMIENPVVMYDSTGELAYDPGSRLLSALIAPGPDPDPIPQSPQLGIDAIPIAVLLDTGPVFVQAPRTFDVLIWVDTSGELMGGVAGDDLILEGVVDVDGDGTAEYSGTLLTGEVLAFGWEDTGTSTDRYDLLFRVTGGSLLPIFGSEFIGVTVTSENSTFTGHFTVPFSGGAKGNIGAAEVCIINTRAVGYTVGSGSHPPVNREPLAGLSVGIYDKSEGSCARQQDQQGTGISHQEYPAIVANCVPVATGVSDENGEITFFLPPGDYLVIGDDGTDKHLGVSASDCFAGVEMNKFLQRITKTDTKKVPGKRKKQMDNDGAELQIVEPEYVVWDSSQELYPFIFETADEFGVTASVTPPEGFVSDYDYLTAEVVNETESVQFTVTELGSDLVPTGTSFTIERNGKFKVIHGEVGVLLSPQYARQRGFNVAQLRGRGLLFEPGAQRASIPVDRFSSRVWAAGKKFERNSVAVTPRRGAAD